MQKKIQELSIGKFTYEEAVLSFSDEKLEIEVLEDGTYQGSFFVKSINGVKMDGMVYSSNERMICENPHFKGREAEIRFEFNSKGLLEGDIQKGKFSVICNGGEYYLSFVAIISADYPRSSMGKIKNVFDFANLARHSFMEAYDVFSSGSFKNIIKKQGQRERMLYEAFSKKPVSMQNMEEFLCELKKKSKVTFTVEEKNKENDCMLDYTNEGDVVQETLNIIKEQWGYIHIEVSTDSPAILLHKQNVTNKDFVGNRGTLTFIIDGELLHAGNNYIKLVFESAHQREVCSMCIYKQGVHSNKDKQRNLKKIQMELIQNFISFRLGNLIASVFKERAEAGLLKLMELEPDNLWYGLFRAQVLIISKENQEAQHLLDQFIKKETEEQADEDTPLYAYYLYLTTLLDKELSYVNLATEHIRRIFEQYKNHPVISWTLLFVDEQLNKSARKKMDLIEQTVLAGCCNPIFYMEAYYLLRREPYLFSKAGNFELQVLNWIVRNNKMTKEIGMQAKNLLINMKKFHGVWYKIAVSCYELWPAKDFLNAICGYCIKWNCYGEEYFKWYQEGIKAELRIAGLYEAWMYSVKQEQMKKMPKNIILYFQYNNNLSYKQQARLYAAMILSEDILRSQYAEFLNMVELFAVEQIRLGRIDENLAVIYEEMLYKEMIDEKMAKSLSNILYLNKLYCDDKKAVRVIVKHKQLKEEQSIPIINQSAYIHIYSNSYCILLEDAKGNRYASNYSWELKRLMSPSHFMKKCMEFAPSEIPYLISYFDGKGTWQTLSPEDIERSHILMNTKQISDEYKRELKNQMIEYYYHTYTGESLDSYLVSIDYESLDRMIKAQLIELLISRGLYEKAYELVKKHGAGQISFRKLASVVSSQIEKQQFEPDDTLSGLCYQIFQRAKYNENIVKYMCEHFHGSIKELAVLWEAAQEYKIDTFELEERIIIQYLYTTDFVFNTDTIFKSYCDAGGDKNIIAAFLSYFSYQYFVKKAVIPDDIFYEIEKLYTEEEHLNEICKLAYFKWLSTITDLTAQREEIVYELMDEFMLKGKRFSFYTKFPFRILRKYHLCDKTFLEYRTNPKNHVTINYTLLDDKGQKYISEDMKSMYEGIFVKEFVVFYGEVIYYYISEEKNGRMEITRSDIHVIHELTACENDGSCYDLINGMMISENMHDDHTLLSLMEQYLKMEEITDTVFHPL